VSYGHDAAKRLTNVTSQAGSFAYTLGGASSGSPLPKKIALPNSSYITNKLDSMARLTGTYLNNGGGTVLHSHAYGYNPANQRTQQVFTAGNFVDYTYDDIGQLRTAKGKESGGGVDRLHEQMGYAYDAAGNLNFRTNNSLIQTFQVNNLNELTNVTRSGTLTVAGTTTGPATNVTVNNLTATLYGDGTFARDGLPLVNGTTNFAAMAQDGYGRGHHHRDGGPAGDQHVCL
jgi:hypothetical protein